MTTSETTSVAAVPYRKVATGIEGLDSIGQGGLIQGRTTLVSGTSGSGKTVLAVQFLYEGMTNFDEPGILVTCEEPRENLERCFSSFGWDLRGLEAAGKLAIIDLTEDPMNPVFIADDHYDFGPVSAMVEHHAKQIGAKRVAFDAIGSLFSMYPTPGHVRRELIKVIARLDRLDMTTMMTIERTKEYGPVARFDVEEFAADGVILLRNAITNQKRHRTLEILKYRGATHHAGEFPFTITGTTGFEVLPLASAKLNMRSSNKRISTGNASLDAMCGGGMFTDSITLLSGATGTGKTLVSTTFADEGAKRGARVLYFGFEESRDQLVRNAAGWGLDFQGWEESGLLRMTCEYPEAKGLEDHLVSMRTAMEEFKPQRVVVDSLSALERVDTPKSFREFIIALTAYAKAHEIPTLFTAVTASLMGGTSVTEAHISTLTDMIILMRYAEVFGEMRRAVNVLKMRGSPHDNRIFNYTIDDSGFEIGEPFRNVSGILSGNITVHDDPDVAHQDPFDTIYQDQ